MTRACLLAAVLLSGALAKDAGDRMITPEVPYWTSPVYFQDGPPPAGKAGGRSTTRSAPLVLVSITPCRLADSRINDTFPFGGPMLQAGEIRTYPLLASQACAIPATARAYALNFTVDLTGLAGLVFLTAWPAGESFPPTSILNAPNPAVRYLANSAVILAGRGMSSTAPGAISVFVTDPVHLIIDVNGYYVEAAETLPSVIHEEPVNAPGSQIAPRLVPTRVAPAIHTLDTDNAVSTAPAWTFRAPRSCVYQASATVRSPLAMPGYHSIDLVVQRPGAMGQTVLQEIRHTSQSGIPASVSLSTYVNLPEGSLLWLNYTQGFSQSSGMQSRVVIQCVRALP